MELVNLGSEYKGQTLAVLSAWEIIKFNFAIIINKMETNPDKPLTLMNSSLLTSPSDLSSAAVPTKRLTRTLRGLSVCISSSKLVNNYTEINYLHQIF